MFLRLLHKIIIFFFSLSNTLILGVVLLLLKILILTKNFYLADQLNRFYYSLILNDKSVQKLLYFIKFIIKYIYMLCLILTITVLFYFFFLLPFNLLQVNVLMAINRAFVIWFCYSSVVLLLVNDEFINKYFEVHQFDNSRFYEYSGLPNTDAHYDLLSDYSATADLLDDLAEYYMDDTARYSLEKQEFFDSYYTYAELTPPLFLKEEALGNPRDSEIFEHKRSDFINQGVIMDDLYLFERWRGLSDQLLNRFYVTRVKKKLQSTHQNSLIFFKLDRRLFIVERFKFFEKQFNLKKNKIVIRDLKDLRSYFLNEVLLNVFLSDNLIFFLNYSKPKLMLQHREKYDFSIYLQNKPKFKNYGFLKRYSLIEFSPKLNPLNEHISNEKIYLSNYDKYIFGGKILNFFNESPFLINFSTILGFNYHVSFLANDIFFCESSLINFVKFIKTNTLFRPSSLRDVGLFSKERFFFFNLQKGNVSLQNEDIKIFLNNNAFNTQYWEEISKLYYNKFFEKIFERVIVFSLNSLTSPILPNVSVFRVFGAIRGLLKNPILFRTFKVLFEKKYFKFLIRYIRRLNLDLLRDEEFKSFSNLFYNSRLLEQTSFLPGQTNLYFSFRNFYTSRNKKLGVTFSDKILSLMFFNNRKFRTFRLGYFSEHDILSRFGNTMRSRFGLANDMFLRLSLSLNEETFFFYNTLLASGVENKNYSNSFRLFSNKLKSQQSTLSRFYKFKIYKSFFVFDNFIFYILYGLPAFLSDQSFNNFLKSISPVKLDYYKYSLTGLNQFSQINNDLFYFPYLNTLNKRRFEKNNFLETILNVNEYALDHVQGALNPIVLNYKLLSHLISLDFSHLNYEFLLIFLQSRRLEIVDYSFFRSHNLLNKRLFLMSLLKSVLTPQHSFTPLLASETLGFFLLNFFKSKFLNVRFYEFYSTQLFSELNVHDLEFLSTFGNQFWLFGSRGVFLDVFKKPRFPYNYWFAGYRLTASVVGIEDFEDNLVVNSHVDYFSTNVARIFAYMEYIDKWLKESFYEYDSIDLLQVYIYYISSVFFLWIWSRIWFTLNADDNDLADILSWDLGDFEDFSDAFQFFATDASVAEGFPEIFGLTYTGRSRNLDENFYYPYILQSLLSAEECLWVEDNGYAGDKRFLRGVSPTISEANSFYYSISEAAFDNDEAEDFVSDFFRTDNRTSEYDLKTILKWLTYGKINTKFPVLTGKSLNYLNYKFLRRPRKYAPYFHNSDLFVFKGSNKDSVAADVIFSRENVFNNFLVHNFEYYFHNFERKYLLERLQSKAGAEARFRHLTKLLRTLSRKSSIAERGWDEVSEFNQYVEEYGTGPYNQSLSHKRRMAIDFESQFFELEERFEIVSRVVYNVLLKIRQNFFYTAAHTGSIGGDTTQSLDPYILSFFKSDIFNVIIRNVTQYGQELAELHNDSMESLPDYLSFIYHLPNSERVKLLNELPDFYKLIFDNMHFFLNDPYLNNDKRPWFHSIYNNPYWISQRYTKKRFYNWWIHLMLQEPVFDLLFASQNTMRGAEHMLSTTFDLYMEVFLEASDFRYDAGYDYLKRLTVTLEMAELQLFNQYLVLKERNFELRDKAFNILSNFLRRRVIRDFFIVPLDIDYRLKGMLPDYYPREISVFYRGLPDFYDKLFFNYDKRQYAYLYNYIINEISPFLNYNDWDLEATLCRHVNYESKASRRRKLNLNQSFFNPRKFNLEAYKTGHYDELLGLALQYIENRYNFSDRLFETASNYFWSQRADHRNYLEYPNVEKNADEIWFDAMEYYTADHYRSTFWEVKIWPQITRRLSGVPLGSPPLVMFDYVTPVPEIVAHRVGNYRIRENKRFRDPVNDEIPFETVQILTEEGSITFMHMVPLFVNTLDWSVRLFNSFFKFFSILPALRFIRYTGGPGDYETRSTRLQDFWTLNVDFWSIYSKKYLTFNEALDDEYASNRYFSSKTFFSRLIGFDDCNISPRLSSSLTTFVRFNNLSQSLNNLSIRFRMLWRDNLESFFYSYLFLNRANFASIVFWLLFMHYLVWYPWLYFQSIVKNWIDYPLDMEDDAMNPHELDNTLTRKRYGLKYKFPEPSMNDIGPKFDDDDVNCSLNDHLASLYNYTDFIAYEGLETNSALSVATSRDLLYYASHVNLVLSNELIDFFTIQIPGYQFTYNLHDIFYMSLFEHKLDSKKGSLPFFRANYIEFLNILIGCKLSREDLYFNYNFITDKNLKFLDKITNQNDFLQYMFSIKSKQFVGDHILNLTEEEFDDPLADSLEFFNTQISVDPYQERFRDYLSSLQIPPKSIWFSYKAFFTSMDLLQFSYKYLISNDQLALLLDVEKRRFHSNNGSNFFLFLGLELGWSFLSRNNFLCSQYKCGETPLPFYLRFNRFNFDFSSNEVETKSIVPSMIEKFLNQKNVWIDSLTVDDKVNYILPEDLSLIHPYTNENVFSMESLSGHLVNLKAFFADLVTRELDFTYKEVILDFHNLEFFEWRSFQLLHTFKVTGVSLEEWLSAVEETKEWLIYLEPDCGVYLPGFTDEFLRLEGNKRFFFYEFDKYALKTFWRLYRQSLESLAMRMYLGRRNRLERSIQYTPYFDSRERYFEEPPFPDTDLIFNRFLSRFEGIPFSRYRGSNNLSDILNRQVKTAVSVDLVCQAISLQYISTDVYYDVYLLLTPEGRAVNRQLVKQSQLQLYSYFNFHLSLKVSGFIFYKNTLLSSIGAEQQVWVPKGRFKGILRLLLVLCVLLCFVLF